MGTTVAVSDFVSRFAGSHRFAPSRTFSLRWNSSDHDTTTQGSGEESSMMKVTLLCVAALVLSCVPAALAQESAAPGAVAVGSDASVVITSPNYPNNYENYVDSVWTLTAPLGMLVSISIPEYDLEDSTGCRYDYIDVDGNQMCGSSDEGYTYVSEGNVATVTFHSDLSIVATGFTASVTAIPAPPVAPGAVAVSPDFSATLASPNYPDNYDNYVRSVWSLTAPVGYVVSISIPEYDLELASGCRYDYIEIAGDRLCGSSDEGYTYVSEGNVATVTFHSDLSIVATGFTASIIAIPPPPVSPGAVAVSPEFSATLASPNYPANYDNYVDSEWSLTAPLGYVVSISIPEYDLEDSTGCQYDYIDVDGNQMCGSSDAGYTYVSEGNVATVTFHSDLSIVATGFTASFIAIPAQGTLTSPGFPGNYDNDLDLSWTLTAPEGMVVAISIGDFALESHSNCNYDYLELDGARLCGDQGAGYEFVSSGNVATVVFHTDYSIVATGFSLTYAAVAPAE